MNDNSEYLKFNIDANIKSYQEEVKKDYDAEEINVISNDKKYTIGKPIRVTIKADIKNDQNLR